MAKELLVRKLIDDLTDVLEILAGLTSNVDEMIEINHELSRKVDESIALREKTRIHLLRAQVLIQRIQKDMLVK